jgi:hypothetical protein
VAAWRSNARIEGEGGSKDHPATVCHVNSDKSFVKQVRAFGTMELNNATHSGGAGV